MKSHNLLRLTQKLYYNPLLLSKPSFDSITAYLDSRNNGRFQYEDTEAETEEQDSSEQEIEDIGVINVHGPLTYKATAWQALCGGCSYEYIIELAEELAESGARTIVLDIDSGGGEAYGAFSCANELRSLCNEYDIELLAYVDGACCSAAYAIACVADEIVTNLYSEVGSIGVLVCLHDTTKAMEDAGVKTVYITGGKDKVPFDTDGTFKKDFLNDLQYKVDFLYSEFVDHVSKYTGLRPEEIRDTEAKTFIAPDALKLGLVNSVKTNNEFAAYVAAKHKVKQTGAM